MTIAIVAVVMLLGVIGTVLPGIPGLPIVWLAALGYGIAEGFSTFGVIAFVIITILSLIGGVAAYVVPPKRAADAGAAKSSIILGIALAIVGAFMIPVLGIAIGGVAGIYIGERARDASHDMAWKATIATLIGVGIGMAIEVTAALLCVFTWVLWAAFG